MTAAGERGRRPGEGCAPAEGRMPTRSSRANGLEPLAPVGMARTARESTRAPSSKPRTVRAPVLADASERIVRARFRHLARPLAGSSPRVHHHRTRAREKARPAAARTPLSTRGFVVAHLRDVRDGRAPSERQPSTVRDARESRVRRRGKRNRTQGGSSHRHGAEELARAVGDEPGSERARGRAGLLREPSRGEGALEAIFPRGARRARPAIPARRPRAQHRIRRRPPAR